MRRYIFAILLIFSLLSICIFIFSYVLSSESNFSGKTIQNIVLGTNTTIPTNLDNIKLDSGTFSVLFYDLKTTNQILINPNEKYYMASIFKIPVAVTVLKQIDQGTLNLTDSVIYTEDDFDYGDGNLQHEDFGTKFSIESLLFKLLQNSDNVAMNILIRTVDIDQVYYTAIELGTDDSFAKDNEGTVFDGKEMFLTLENTNILTQDSKNILYEYMQNTSFEDRIALGLDSSSKLVHKIGTWPESGNFHDCGIVIRKDNDQYILCILTKDTTFEDASNLSKNITRYFEQSYK